MRLDETIVARSLDSISKDRVFYRFVRHHLHGSLLCHHASIARGSPFVRLLAFWRGKRATAESAPVLGPAFHPGHLTSSSPLHPALHPDLQHLSPSRVKGERKQVRLLSLSSTGRIFDGATVSTSLVFLL